ncbi:hypothetical protein A2851_02650 [Candidatus Kaiserbacteria bacterium RIFCSPHIGHO2_01_FULL_53_29]|uniref:Uncharacterized protein n=1 Tax=Candidatus Kaiserbacteria bacterium RIFCSPHIGHO2_01_FULL_53_29 TaxID=1798480 RepID=A0A1F6CXH6_9BACT|nr:MAG: hypothetical protein A2851_02650 [Candidatus Kaiserbacteria bacterium RIFCSPHIGHO2_01_FULL_53_29]
MLAHDEVLTRMLENTYTKADFYRRTDLMQEFLEHVLFNGEKHSDSRALRFRDWEKGRDDEATFGAVVAWGDTVLDSFTPENLHVRIKEQKQELETLPEIVLYVPVALSPLHVASLGAWCRMHVRKNTLLRLMVEPAVAGGCAFAFDNVYHDFSLRYFMQKNHPALIELVRTYGVT